MAGSLPSTSSSSLLPYTSQQPENTILECRVCDEVFHLQGDKVPRLLICGHTVCHQCLGRLTVHGHAILCPFDRQPTDIGDSGIWGLKKNFALLELLERLQFSPQSTARQCGLTDDMRLAKERDFAIPCDENEMHTAVVYCITCATHLCLDCSETIHNTRTLIKHKRVPISEKPKENPKCAYHPMHFVEFACVEEECKTNPLMCYICKDYGRHLNHKHSLLETESEVVRTAITNALVRVRSFGEEVRDSIRKISTSIHQMEGGYTVVQNINTSSSTQQVPGSIDEARIKVRNYFHALRETLNRQEIAALTTVDTHIREKLCMLQQQQEDMTMLLSQITAVCHQWETTMNGDDTKVLLAKTDIGVLLDTIQKQQQQFSDLQEHITLDPLIPITFTKDNRVHIGPKIEMRVVILGLDDAGKTSLLFKMKNNEFITTIPTIGFNVETVEYKNVKLTIWDVGGQHKIRPLWKHYYFNTQAVIFVIDSHNTERLDESHNALVKLVQEKELKDASLLIFANKQDLQPCVSIEELTEKFGLFKLCCNRSWHIQACDTNMGTGLQEGLEWLSRQIVAAGAPDLP
ncbi:E3 ubiquitin-protein ligase TRIM23-like [Mya arenaria]|uniref:E3 ubiquitin-protein ligase TRIM23-like n=1 Tax=Mya arenaria TaxID=6604 RepID=UPI0022DED4FC|nr:E3 ubiquitin-protein ligase TRIM23-like [Mya arenaria]